MISKLIQSNQLRTTSAISRLIRALIAILIILMLSPVVLYASAGDIGDVSHDGVIDGYDAVLILRHDVGVKALTSFQRANADTDESGSIDGYDAVLILQCDVGLIPCEFGTAVCGNGIVEPGETCDNGDANIPFCDPTTESPCYYCRSEYCLKYIATAEEYYKGTCDPCIVITGKPLHLSGGYCGDGMVETNENEECDDFDLINSDDCSWYCFIR